MKPNEFRRFITAPPRAGLGQDFDAMRSRFCKTPALMEEWDRATVGKQGSDGVSNNQTGRNQFSPEHETAGNKVNRDIVPVNHEPPRGNDPQYALRRLRKQAPELHARVLAGELSPHRAMVEAGFRDRTIQLPLVPRKAARVLRRHFTDDEFESIVALFREGEADDEQGCGRGHDAGDLECGMSPGNEG